MAKLLKAFDSDKHADMDTFEAVPPNEYVCTITKSEWCKTRDYDSTKHKYLKFEFTIQKGEFKGRKFWTNLNFVNKNVTTVEIAEKVMASITRAIFGGNKKIEDTEMLHNKPLICKVGKKAGKGDNPPQNSLISVKPIKAVAEGGGKPPEKQNIKKKKDESGPGWGKDK